MLKIISNIKGIFKKPNITTEEMIAQIHDEDEMFLFFTTHPAHKDTPLKSYFESGEGMIKCLNEILIKAETSFENIGCFLEFACGYGRFTRHLIKHIEPRKISVSDIYQKAVDFQKKTFGVNGFYSKADPEELIIPNKYDVIFVASLFSHLPEKNWYSWLKNCLAL